MFGWVHSYLGEVCCFFILTEMLLQFSPAKQYEPYLKVLAGLCALSVVLLPMGVYLFEEKGGDLFSAFVTKGEETRVQSLLEENAVWQAEREKWMQDVPKVLALGEEKTTEAVEERAEKESAEKESVGGGKTTGERAEEKSVDGERAEEKSVDGESAEKESIGEERTTEESANGKGRNTSKIKVESVKISSTQ